MSQHLAALKQEPHNKLTARKKHNCCVIDSSTEIGAVTQTESMAAPKLVSSVNILPEAPIFPQILVDKQFTAVFMSSLFSHRK